jgi:hypothetical protein
LEVAVSLLLPESLITLLSQVTNNEDSLVKFIEAYLIL